MYMFQPTIDKDLIKDFPIEVFPGKIHLVDTARKLKPCLETLNKETILGFDTETKPCFTKGCRTTVSLLQLSTQEDCYLIRLNKVGMTSEIIDLLSNEKILKVGLSIHDDYISLRRKEPFEQGGFVELQKLCPGYGIKDSSLRKVYAIMFGKAISKAQQLSNWENAKLTAAQQAYAALDAWACLQIYNKLMTLPSPHPVKFALL